MFGTFAALQSLPRQRPGRGETPAPTAITLPSYQPSLASEAADQPRKDIQYLLQNPTKSPPALGPDGFSALGLDLTLDATLRDLVPDVSLIPDFDGWGKLSKDEATEANASTRMPLRNGNLSPGCQVYLERMKELAHDNEQAFRTVRRRPPPPGQQQARLGNAYEFFRCLELITAYWDDTSLPKQEQPPTAEPAGPAKPAAGEQPYGGRIASGSSMSADYRQNLVSALIKLVAYDFGCNISNARHEPRLQLSSPKDSDKSRKTYFPSACSFIFQSPTTREAARAGIVQGPVAAVSVRGVTDFATPDAESAQAADLAREMIAALITAQHRARNGQKEKRFGEGEWWTTKARWGGGSGGPIGREIDRDTVQGDKDVAPTDDHGNPTRVSKKARKNMSIYDNYRMVRPPALNWDQKARYEAIGKQPGMDHDDIFVLSSLFHHLSIIRVRVPLRLLEVLGGEPEPKSAIGEKTWGRLPAWRSKWFDMFSIDDRTEAMRYIWAIMAYQMRAEEADKVDTSMTGA